MRADVCACVSTAQDGEKVVELKPGYALPHDHDVGGT